MAWGAYRAKAESTVHSHFFSRWSVRRKLLFSLIPSILFILVVAGYVTNWYSSRYLSQALQRTAQVQNLSQAREMEQLLDYFRLSLCDLAKAAPGEAEFRAAFDRWAVHHPGVAVEVSFVGINTNESTIMVNTLGGLASIRQDQYNFIKGSPVSQALKLRGVKPGTVQLSRLTEVVYPPSAFAQQAGPQNFVLYRMATPVQDSQGALRGYLVLGIDSHALRNILSLYNSPKSPLFAFARTSETRFSYFFDDQGWILFQSENLEDPDRELSVEMARLGMTGDFGMSEYGKAFRPLPKHEGYWHMVVDVQAGRVGVDDVSPGQDTEGLLSANHFVVYAPVVFTSNPERGPEIIGGVAYVDRSRLTDAAEFRHLDVMLVITFSGMALVASVIVFISRAITKPLHELAAEIRTMFENKTLRQIRMDSRDLESSLLTRALNKMIYSIQEKQELIRRRDEQIHQVQQREKVSFDSEVPASVGWRLVGDIPDLVGQSQAIVTMQSMIRKAASTSADVLVVGETGTGKELTAEGVHKFSNRADKPFISINCGGLDENLLMDTLFGHVKGAFTEARTDRKGAFLASDGGTLFLDEIGTATDKVQKALLRALSVRRIRPLGSDQEIEFNVRVIAATNVDLMELVQRGEFRDDLYYRLKVITIQTPPLRQRKDDIPVLANHFLRELATTTGTKEFGLSRGALEKLMEHDWPGNVRELKNCITRATAFAEGEVLYAEDLVFDDASVSPATLFGDSNPASAPSYERNLASMEQAARREHDTAEPAGGAIPHAAGLPGQANGAAAHSSGGQGGSGSGGAEGDARPQQKDPDLEQGGNQRFRVALRLARERGSFSRLDYQRAVGAEISQRTAQYDLQVLVARGILRKTGRGPATQYLLA